MPRIIVIDSGGAARPVRRMFVVDTGGTARLVRRAFVIDAGGTARLILASEPTISLNPTYDGDDSTLFPVGAGVTFRLTSTGLIQTLNSGGTLTLGSWIDDVSQAGNYEVLATLISGTLTSGTIGTYQSLSTNRTWVVSKSGAGSKTCTFSIQIRKTGTGTVLDSSNITLTASVDA